MSQGKEPNKHLNYRSAGVDIDAGNRLVGKIKALARDTERPGTLGGIGGFGALYELPLERYTRPVLVAGTDGVGTKLKLAIQLGKHDTIGIDLVAMCANDVLVQGAEPLFFLDYYATGRLQEDTAAEVIAGIAAGCKTAGMALIGGETAEMPGMYQGGDYDLAGFCVGLVEKEHIIDGSRVGAGDVLIGLASSGPHANGYSLIRKILEVSGQALSAPLGDQTLGECLLAPTRIYVKPLLSLLSEVPVHAMAHITGGGLLENVPRVLPATARAVIDARTWPMPPVFHWLREQGGLPDAEMYKTFNCGIGMVVCVPARSGEAALELLRRSGETAWPIGVIEAREAEQAPIAILSGDDD